MFSASDWQKFFEHKTYIAKVYKAGATWTYEYQGDGVTSEGYAPTAELAMAQIENYVKAGICIKKKK